MTPRFIPDSGNFALPVPKWRERGKIPELIPQGSRGHTSGRGRAGENAEGYAGGFAEPEISGRKLTQRQAERFPTSPDLSYERSQASRRTRAVAAGS